MPWKVGGRRGWRGSFRLPQAPHLCLRDLTPGPAVPAALGQAARLLWVPGGPGPPVRLGQPLWGHVPRGWSLLACTSRTGQPHHRGWGLALVWVCREGTLAGVTTCSTTTPGPLVSLRRPAWVAFG